MLILGFSRTRWALQQGKFAQSMPVNHGCTFKLLTSWHNCQDARTVFAQGKYCFTNALKSTCSFQESEQSLWTFSKCHYNFNKSMQHKRLRHLLSGQNCTNGARYIGSVLEPWARVTTSAAASATRCVDAGKNTKLSLTISRLPVVPTVSLPQAPCLTSPTQSSSSAEEREALTLTELADSREQSVNQRKTVKRRTFPRVSRFNPGAGRTVTLYLDQKMELEPLIAHGINVWIFND